MDNQNERTYIINQLWQYIQTIPNLPSAVHLEQLGDAPSLMLQQIEGEIKSNTNILGDCNYQFPFAIWHRIDGNDESNILQGTNVLNNISDFFDLKTQIKELPNLDDKRICTKIEMVTLPYCKKINDNGDQDYIANYVLHYKQRK